MTALLSRRPNDFVQRNLFLHAVLGLTSFSQRLERACAARSSTLLAQDEPVVLAALGLLAIGREVEGLLARAQDDRARNPVEPSVVERVPPLGSLLR